MTANARRSASSHLSPWDVAFDAIIAIVMVVVVFCSLYPFLYILLYSFSNSTMVGTGLLLWPKGFNVDAYKLMLADPKIPHALLISVLRSTISPAGALLVTSMAAYAMSRRELMGRGFIIKFLMITMYFSSGMIPSYLLISNLGLIGTFWVYVIPGLFGVFDMVLIKTFMEGLPSGLTESAMIDGASDFKILFSVVLPLCKPVLAAILLFSCVNHWNAYTDTMLYNASKSELHTLSYVLMNFIQTNVSSVEDARRKASMNTVNTTTLKMVLTVVTVAPIMCVYPMLQKYFASGLLIGSIKG